MRLLPRAICPEEIDGAESIPISHSTAFVCITVYVDAVSRFDKIINDISQEFFNHPMIGYASETVLIMTSVLLLFTLIAFISSKRARNWLRETVTVIFEFI